MHERADQIYLLYDTEKDVHWNYFVNKIDNHNNHNNPAQKDGIHQNTFTHKFCPKAKVYS